jgi:predicted nucleic acid-binding Zn ribbon protein
VAQSEQQRKANLRLAWVLASVALVLGVGFMVKIALFNH